MLGLCSPDQTRQEEQSRGVGRFLGGKRRGQRDVCGGQPVMSSFTMADIRCGMRTSTMESPNSVPIPL
jgi:hypothetical protein